MLSNARYGSEFACALRRGKPGWIHQRLAVWSMQGRMIRPRRLDPGVLYSCGIAGAHQAAPLPGRIEFRNP